MVAASSIVSILICLLFSYSGDYIMIRFSLGLIAGAGTVAMFCWSFFVADMVPIDTLVAYGVGLFAGASVMLVNFLSPVYGNSEE